MTSSEVAISVNVSKATVLAAIRKGELQAWRPAPNLLRIQPEHLVEWMNKMSNTKATKKTTATRLRAIEGGQQ